MRIVWNKDLYHADATYGKRSSYKNSKDRAAYYHWYYMNYKKKGRKKGWDKKTMKEEMRLRDRDPRYGIAADKRDKLRPSDWERSKYGKTNLRRSNSDAVFLAEHAPRADRKAIKKQDRKSSWEHAKQKFDRATTHAVQDVRTRYRKWKKDDKEMSVTEDYYRPKRKKGQPKQSTTYKNKHGNSTIEVHEFKNDKEADAWLKKEKKREQQKKLSYKAKKAYKSVSKKAVKKGRRMLKRFKSII